MMRGVLFLLKISSINWEMETQKQSASAIKHRARESSSECISTTLVLKNSEKSLNEGTHCKDLLY